MQFSIHAVGLTLFLWSCINYEWRLKDAISDGELIKDKIGIFDKYFSMFFIGLCEAWILIGLMMFYTKIFHL